MGVNVGNVGRNSGIKFKSFRLIIIVVVRYSIPTRENVIVLSKRGNVIELLYPAVFKRVFGSILSFTRVTIVNAEKLIFCYIGLVNVELYLNAEHRVDCNSL